MKLSSVSKRAFKRELIYIEPEAAAVAQASVSSCCLPFGAFASPVKIGSSDESAPPSPLQQPEALCQVGREVSKHLGPGEKGRGVAGV